MEGKPVLGIIGGSGLYKMGSLKNVNSFEVETPFGKPSSPIIIGTLSNKRVAFLSRHGIGHVLSPSEVNYRANIYALKTLGVERIVSISACGSLREDLRPGHIVIPDQLFDFTRGKRKRTFFEGGLVSHIGSADPFCAELSSHVYKAVVQVGATAHMGGTFITIEGPRFSTKAESKVFQSWGMSIIGMTASPEAYLAREAELCYATMGHVTDYDVWHESEEPVSVEMVIKTLSKNTDYAQKAIEVLAENLKEETGCDCKNALASALITQPDKIPAETKKKLAIFVDKYLPK
ncbi:MAG: S-methyl-5'-thioadenosine phosphorylase [Anaerolineaceae bacterium]|nr:S-methyl-5'-thioadenosine phosphorylase [Anaerolineaceae bacterium]